MGRSHFSASSARSNRAWWGTLNLLLGLTIVGAVVILSVLALTNDARLRTEFTPLVPPGPSWLERTLYSPRGIRTEDLGNEGGGSLSELLGEDSAGEADNSDAGVPGIQRPPMSAAVGKTYRYTPTMEDGSAVTTVSLEVTPNGMMVQDRSVTWTPPSGSVGTQSVQLTVQSETGHVVRQSFDILVSGKRHLLGTDIRGRDTISALVLGAKWALLPGVLMAIIAVCLGVAVGTLSGYYSKVDRWAGFGLDVIESIPALLVLFLAASIFQFNLYWVMAALGLVWAPRVARLVRTRVQQLKASQFVEALQEMGMSDRKIMLSEILFRNMRTLVLSEIAFALAFSIVVETTLSYLRLGVQPPDVSWGSMLFEGRAFWYDKYWLTAIPALAITISVSGFLLLGASINRLTETRTA